MAHVRWSRRWPVVLVSVFALVAAACGEDEPEPPADDGQTQEFPAGQHDGRHCRTRARSRSG